MTDLLKFLIDHGEGLVFVVVLLEQAGLPLPSMVFLIAAGAMVGAGTLNAPLVMGLALAGALIPNYVWFVVGRRKGNRILSLLCRISLDPDACVRLSEHAFARYGPAALLVAKFMPGLNTLASPLLGMLRVGTARFLLFNLAGTVLWIVVSVGIGHVFSGQLEQVAAWAAQWGITMAVVVVTLTVGWGAFKYLQRQILLRRLRVGRITVDELQEKLASGEEVVVVDLRHPLEREVEPASIPGALTIAPGELQARQGEIPRDKDVILYCS